MTLSNLPSAPEADVPAAPLTILYQDTDLVAIDKPAGLLVHRTELDTLATEFAVQRLRDQIGLDVFPCHRLDRPTSGILLFALNKDALRRVQAQFTAQAIDKSYLAVVRGWTDDGGLVDYDLRSEEDVPKEQSAQTEYRCLRRSEIPVAVGRYKSIRLSLLQLHPLTGRKHQLRRHLAHIRHPILGDTRHGDGSCNRFLRDVLNRQQLLLRAIGLNFVHPRTSERVSLNVATDFGFTQALERLDLSA